MIKELNINDTVITNQLKVYYLKEKASGNLKVDLFRTSKDTNLIYVEKSYFNHLINYNINNNQLITDNLDLVVNVRSQFCKGLFPHFAQDEDKFVQINDNGISFHNSKPLLFISSITQDKCYNLLQKIIRLQILKSKKEEKQWII